MNQDHHHGSSKHVGITCIGNLESQIHSMFVKERVPGEDFVFATSPDAYNILDDFCDESNMQESKTPLLILGPSGCGKSALLANWLLRRQRNMSRARSDEFIFCHVVGCSRHSLDVNNLMRRLMTDLKNRFELSRDVPSSQSRLSWDFPRFLELASKKGKTIIVIDGLQRLQSNEGETNLSWLPLEFPPNVRIVLSATSEGALQQENSKQNHILSELERRKLQVMQLSPFDAAHSRNIIDIFVKKTVQQECSASAGGAFLTSMIKYTHH